MKNSALVSSLRFAILCIGFAACAKATSPALGGETNWLKHCSDSDSCELGSCICGVCTTRCDADKQCTGGVAGTCIDANDEIGASVCGPSPARPGGLCLPICMSDADCGGSFACREGVCVTGMAATRMDVMRESDAPMSTAAGPDSPAAAQTDSQPIDAPEPPATQPGAVLTPPAAVGPAQPPAESACPDGTHPGSVVIQLRSDIDKLRDCKQVAGDVLIISDALEDLSGLEGLRVVEGNFIVAPNEQSAFNFMSSPTATDSKLKSLKGLEGLKSVGTLVLLGLEIATLEPLSLLETAPFVWVRYMPRLRDLKGLDKLDWEKLSLANNAELVSLAGLRVQASKHTMLEVADCPKVSDLTALQGLVSVADNIKLSYLDIGDLSGLRALERVGNPAMGAGGLWISGCARLRDLNGLGKLESTAALVLAENEGLETLGGLALTAPPKTFGITGSPRVTSLAPAIPAGAWDAHSVDVERMPGLKSLRDFAGLQSATSLMIQQCDGLSDLTGLEQLKTAGQVFITTCAGLTSVKGVENLATVMGVVAVSRNPALTNARPLGNLKSFGGVVLEGNEVLPQCEVDWLAQRLNTMLPAGLNGAAGTCAP